MKAERGKQTHKRDKGIAVNIRPLRCELGVQRKNSDRHGAAEVAEPTCCHARQDANGECSARHRKDPQCADALESR